MATFPVDRPGKLAPSTTSLKHFSTTSSDRVLRWVLDLDTLPFLSMENFSKTVPAKGGVRDLAMAVQASIAAWCDCKPFEMSSDEMPPMTVSSGSEPSAAWAGAGVGSGEGAATSGSAQEGGYGGQTVNREGDNRNAMVTSRVPQDVGDGSDDDVVARQIREAAMNERDPVLREKLWQEYRNYKRALDR